MKCKFYEIILVPIPKQKIKRGIEIVIESMQYYNITIESKQQSHAQSRENEQLWPNSHLLEKSSEICFHPAYQLLLVL
jgi:hypothetical protein